MPGDIVIEVNPQVADALLNAAMQFSPVCGYAVKSPRAQNKFQFKAAYWRKRGYKFTAKQVAWASQFADSHEAKKEGTEEHIFLPLGRLKCMGGGICAAFKSL